jgi:hypothetical protein
VAKQIEKGYKWGSILSAFFLPRKIKYEIFCEIPFEM